MSRHRVGIAGSAGPAWIALALGVSVSNGGCKGTPDRTQPSAAASASAVQSATASSNAISGVAPSYQLAELDHASVARLVASLKWQKTQTKRSPSQKYQPGEDWTSLVSIYDGKAHQAQVSFRCYADPRDLAKPTLGQQAYFDQGPCRLNVSVNRVAGDQGANPDLARKLLRQLLAAPDPAK